MGQKVHPTGFRIGVTETHRSQWFAKPKDYAKLVEEDLLIRDFVERRLPEAGISRVNISRQVDRIEIEFFTARPRALVGAKGETLTQLRDEIKAKLPDTRNVALYVTKTQQPEMEAICIAENIAEQLEKRTPFRVQCDKQLCVPVKLGQMELRFKLPGV